MILSPHLLGGDPAHKAVGFITQDHQRQYNDSIATFFDDFNRTTGRAGIFYGFIAGIIAANPKLCGKNKVAVDFGCGTGWLAEKLSGSCFSRVFGIDTSNSMLAVAFSRSNQEIVKSGALCYRSEVPEELEGKCSFVTAIHVHHHFEPFAKLKTDFFGRISSLLAPEGQAVVIGCPSDFVADTPSHFFNSISINDVPKDVLSMASDPNLFKDEDGFIPLKCLPHFQMENGTRMKATFIISSGQDSRQATLIDTFWSDKALANAAEESGLKLLQKSILASGNHKNAYMALHFKKKCKRAQHIPN